MFATGFEREEEEFRRQKNLKAAVITLLVHGLIALALFVLMIKTPIPPFPELAGGGVEVNLGYDDVGTGDVQAFSYNPGPMSTAPATKSSAAPLTNQENILTQEHEDIDAEAVTTDKPVKPKPNVITPPSPPVTKPSNNPTKSNTNNTQSNPAPAPVPNQEALFTKGAKGTPNNSSGDGTGGGQGDQGKPDGDPNAKNYLGDGGDGDRPGPGGSGSGGYNLRGRSKVALPAPAQCNTQGKVVIEIKVDRSGKVVAAKFLRFSSTVFDDCNVNNALAAAKKAVFNADPNADEIQTGTITYIYKVN
ncbi:MAG: TonB family protein [Chitinophagales bacterium]|nr:TonB family protein [Chitinophagales bacterium]MDW8418693.1 TonB family protein [Chitinophagales bacterium]